MIEIASANVRVARPEDGARVAEIYAPYVVETPITFETEAPSADAMSERIARTLARFPWLVWEEGGRISGYAYASEHRARAAYRWCVEVAVYVDAAAQRRGVGRELYRSLFPVLARQGLRNAYAGITLPNAASVGLHEEVGFERLAVYRRIGWKLGAWHDVGWWERSLALHTPDPAEPIPFAGLRA